MLFLFRHRSSCAFLLLHGGPLGLRFFVHAGEDIYDLLLLELRGIGDLESSGYLAELRYFLFFDDVEFHYQVSGKTVKDKNSLFGPCKAKAGPVNTLIALRKTDPGS